MHLLFQIRGDIRVATPVQSSKGRRDYSALIRLLFGLCSTSAKWRTSSTGGTYMPNLPRSPFFNPYHPPTGFFRDRPHASIVPSAAGFCSSALPRSIQSPRDLSIECRSLMHRRGYRSSVLPDLTTSAGGSSASSRNA